MDARRACWSGRRLRVLRSSARHRVSRFCSATRRSFAPPFTDDDPIVNPCLTRKMELLGLKMPPVDDWELFQPQTYLERVQHEIAGQAGWQVTPKMVIGLFSFAKYMMYKALCLT